MAHSIQKDRSKGGNHGGPSRSGLTAARRTRAERVSDQTAYLVVLHCSYRWLRHRSDRLRSAKPRQGMGLETGRARTGVQRKPCWHSVWFSAVWLDRRPYGRKAALVWSNLLFGVFTLAAAYATNLDQMFWLRLLAGLGIGGVIPNVVAINAESAPRKLRATLAIIAVGCVPIGGAIPGFVTAALVPQYGWQIL